MLSEQIRDLEQTLWQTADTLRAYSDIKSTEYSTPVLGLIFLNFAKENKSQKVMAEKTLPFFEKLHELLKIVDRDVRTIEKKNNRAKDILLLKTELKELHREVKDTEYFFTHIHWLQERFPEAQYENVTGFCKLATMDEVKEQEYSLNPGRYVGVVIEEDGKIEKEFTAEIVGLNDELDALNKVARKFESVIAKNIAAIAGEV